MKQKTKESPVEVSAQPAPPVPTPPVTRLSPEELSELGVWARKEHTRFKDFGGDGVAGTLALLLFDTLHATRQQTEAVQEQNRLLSGLVASLQPGQK
ncbi:MAG TPA: hypothetical protein VEL31_12665 [Ktedonobacteraceae bacterium]|nr:hypothetical protein [Ktedonobacteraceae bacterium]